jgi:signal transduction histidine kinase
MKSTKSLERQLQAQLAINLVLVMVLIWVVGNVFSYAIPQETSSHRFRWMFPILASLGISTILLLQRSIIRNTFRQLDGIRLELQQLKAGQISQLNEVVPAEMESFVKELNHLLRLMHDRLERSRNALGNLAHALKTPLCWLQQYVEDLDNPTAVMQCQRIRQLTERELKRARMAGLGKTLQDFDPHTELPMLIHVLRQVHLASPQIDCTICPAITRFGDREDMLELIGNLLDNACKWARNQVVCRVSLENHQVHIVIEDDGIGCNAVELQQLSERGVRLDETVAGYGLGLAICKDIVQLYGGTLVFARSPSLGGLLVCASVGLRT